MEFDEDYEDIKDEDILSESEFLFIRKILDTPKKAKWLIYKEVFDCSEKSAKVNATRFCNRPNVKKLIKKLRIDRHRQLHKASFWGKNRLVYEYSRLAEVAENEGHPIFDKSGCQVGHKPDYSTVKGCYDSIGKIEGVFEKDNDQRKPVNTINLGDYFNKKELT